MSNKQVVAIFIIGIALLLAAFWAGLVIVKQDAPASANQSPGAAVNQNAALAQAGKAAANANLVTRPPNQPATDESARYVVLIGKYGTLDQAKQIQAEIRRDYIAAYVQMPSGGDTLYAVAIGPYSRKEAEQVAADLSNKRKGIMIQPWTQN